MAVVASTTEGGAADHNDRQVQTLCVDKIQHSSALYARHRQIQQEQVIVGFGKVRQGLPATGDDSDLIPLDAEATPRYCSGDSYRHPPPAPRMQLALPSINPLILKASIFIASPTDSLDMPG
jgi:hypothetical protein